MTTFKALKIPFDDSKPVEEVIYDEDADNGLRDLVFGPDPVNKPMTDYISVSSIRQHNIQFVYDDEGMFNQPLNLNVRARKFWAHLLGTTVEKLVTLHGDYIVLGLDPDEGDTLDCPAVAYDYFAEEGVRSNG